MSRIESVALLGLGVEAQRVGHGLDCDKARNKKYPAKIKKLARAMISVQNLGVNKSCYFSLEPQPT